MKKFGTIPALLLPTLSAICIAGTLSAHAQQATIKRTDLTTADHGTDSGALWVADIAPGAATGAILIQHRGSSMF